MTREPADLRTLIERLLPGGESRGSTASSFVRGLTAGALIGAAIAGSALVQRQRSKRAELEEAAAELEEATAPVTLEGRDDPLVEARPSS